MYIRAIIKPLVKFQKDQSRRLEEVASPASYTPL